MNTATAEFLQARQTGIGGSDIATMVSERTGTWRLDNVSY